ncbi:MAG TPA: SLC13 family permease [Stellaceae bacterium]|nr:SLC13 family permease [Stellaceae bacterium]
MIATLVIFAATYLVVAIGRVPGLRLDRAGAALIGAALMVAAGSLSLNEAYRAIDLDTLALLLGMMLVVANLRLSGFFALCHAAIVARAHRPVTLLIGIALIAGLLSAVLVNDAVCLMLTPLVVETARAVKRNPVPYLLALAMASNAGSLATIIGNPQNMMIGSFSHIGYGDFAAHLAPVAALALAVVVILIVLVWRREFLGGARFAAEMPAPRIDLFLLVKTVAVTVAIVLACFFGMRPSLAAILGGSLLFLTRRVKPARIYRDVDWSLLLLFVGLFVVVAAMQKAVLTPSVLRGAGGLALNQTPILALVAAVLSNLVSNVPAVLVLKPFVANLADPRHGWLVLAMASTLAGNFTLLGSVANLIVVQGAERRGVAIGFWTYFLVGGPVTVITLAAGAAWLAR